MWLGLFYNSFFLFFFLLKNKHLALLKNKNSKVIVFLLECYLLVLPLTKSIKISKNRFIWAFRVNYENNFLFLFLKIILNKIQFIINFFFKKIKFNGKGYYLYKNKKNTLALQFNFSHKLILPFSYIFIKNFSKRSWLFFGLNKADLNLLVNLFKNFRSINVFTLNGIRFSKQLVLFKKINK